MFQLLSEAPGLSRQRTEEGAFDAILPFQALSILPLIQTSSFLSLALVFFATASLATTSVPYILRLALRCIFLSCSTPGLPTTSLLHGISNLAYLVESDCCRDLTCVGCCAHVVVCCTRGSCLETFSFPAITLESTPGPTMPAGLACQSDKILSCP